MQQLDDDLSQRREEDNNIPTETELRPSFPRSVKRNLPTRYMDHYEEAGSDCDYDDDMYVPPSSFSASSSENGDEEPYVRDTRI